MVYDLTQPRPRQLVRRRDRIEVTERLSGLGEVVTELTDAEIDRVARAVADREPAAVAVSLLFSYLDDRHEKRLGDAIAKRLPDTPVTLSSAAAREFREYPRTSTAVINAALRPVVGRYLLRLRSLIGALGIAPAVQIMQSSGGCLPADRAADQAHRLVLSGPAAGVARAVALGARYGLGQLVSLDMGGTSLDVCLIPDGVPPVTARQEIGGSPILAPAVDIVTVGAGGGSIAQVDRALARESVRESAGARPGPAAYGHGGEQATLTDAHVAAGTPPAALPLAGQLPLDAGAALAALEPVAAALAWRCPTRPTASCGWRWPDDGRPAPRVGAARHRPARLHAGRLRRRRAAARRAAAARHGLPGRAGAAVPRPVRRVRPDRHRRARVDDSRTVLRVIDPGLLGDLADWYATAGRELTRQLRRDGAPPGAIRLAATADCRFLGQGYELSVPLRSTTKRGLAGLAADFRRAAPAHLRARQPGTGGGGGECPAVRVRRAAVPVRPPGAGADPSAAPPARLGRVPASARAGTVAARLPGTAAPREPARVPAGPDRPRPGRPARAIVHQLDTTTVVLPGQRARADELGSLWLEEAR